VPLGNLGDAPYESYELHRRPSYRTPLGCMFGWTLAGPIVGMGLSAVDTFIERTTGSKAMGRSAETLPMQLRIAEAASEVDAARLIMRTDVRDVLDMGAREEPVTDAARTKLTRNRSFCVKLIMRAVNRLFEASGGHALFEHEAIQRIHRDAHAASHRTGLIFDLGGGEQWGRSALGLEVVRGLFGT
jgi:3-hydroxy-9,10-secoandrosta-1,3,5(10)-triene-9,17-dione monooxygenase